MQNANESGIPALGRRAAKSTSGEKKRRKTIPWSAMYAVMQVGLMVLFGAIWSYLFITLLNGPVFFEYLFPWATTAFSTSAIYLTGIVFCLVLAMLIGGRYSGVERFVIASHHIGVLLILFALKTSVISRVAVILALTVWLGGFCIDRFRGVGTRREGYGEQPQKQPQEQPQEQPQAQPQGKPNLNFLAPAIFSLYLLLVLVHAGTPDDLARTQPVDIELARVVDEETFVANLRSEGENWADRGVAERADLLRSVIEYECVNELGCPVPQMLVADLPGSVLGSYGRAENLIKVDRGLLEALSLEESLNTVLHESRHAYQAKCADMVIALSYEDPGYLRLNGIRELATSYNTEKLYELTHSREEYATYVFDPDEEDARHYAEGRLANYYLPLFDYGDAAEKADDDSAETTDGDIDTETD